MTTVDFDNEKLFNQMVKKEFPEFTVIGEEFSIEDEPTDKYFLIDPLDGTVNYANQLPFWGVQAECKINHKTVAAVIYLPEFNELYVADENNAYLNRKIMKTGIKSKPLKENIWAFLSNKTTRLDILSKHLGGLQGYRRFYSTAVEFAFAAKGHLDCVCFFNKKRVETAGVFIGKMAGLLVNEEPENYWVTKSEEIHKFLKNRKKITCI